MTNSAIAYKELKYVINEINIKYEKLDNLFREI